MKRIHWKMPRINYIYNNPNTFTWKRWIIPTSCNLRHFGAMPLLFCHGVTKRALAICKWWLTETGKCGSTRTLIDWLRTFPAFTEYKWLWSIDIYGCAKRPFRPFWVSVVSRVAFVVLDSAITVYRLINSFDYLLGSRLLLYMMVDKTIFLAEVFRLGIPLSTRPRFVFENMQFQKSNILSTAKKVAVCVIMSYVSQISPQGFTFDFHFPELYGILARKLRSFCSMTMIAKKTIGTVR